MGLADYKGIVEFLATWTAIGQLFAPAFMCRDIIKQGNTHNFDATPFVGGLVMCALLLENALLLSDRAMLTVNTFGMVLNTIYFIIYYFYTADRPGLFKLCEKGAAFVALMIAYAYLGPSDSVSFYYSLVVTLYMFVLIASPLFGLREIIETKSTAKLPFPLILSGFVVTFLWLLYGIIIENVFLQAQNIVGFTLCAIQLSLFAIYPSGPSEVVGDKKAN